MTTPELTQDDALVMAAQCPLIRAAYASEDATVIARVERDHPPSRCDYVKQARAAAEAAAAEETATPPAGRTAR